MRPTEFLETLWGNTPPGLVQLWDLKTRVSNYLRSPAGANAIAYTDRPDMYTGVALAHKDLGRHRRARADQAIAIAGLWLDIDVNGGPENKTGVAPGKDPAVSLAHVIAHPTVIVDSGYGVHGWWLFEAPWRFTSRDEQEQGAVASAQWYQLHRTQAQLAGWTVDHTHDLARLLRLPGTVNAKGGAAAPVRVLSADGPRYQRHTLLGYASEAGPVELAGASATTGGALPDVVARDGAAPNLTKLDALLTNSDEFARTWAHKHPHGRDWSLSEYDLSLASQAAHAGWLDQELADLVAFHRRKWDAGDRKAGRTDYLRRTVAKARESAERASAPDRLRDLATRRAAA